MDELTLILGLGFLGTLIGAGIWILYLYGQLAGNEDGENQNDGEADRLRQERDNLLTQAKAARENKTKLDKDLLSATNRAEEAERRLGEEERLRETIESERDVAKMQGDAARRQVEGLEVKEKIMEERINNALQDSRTADEQLQASLHREASSREALKQEQDTVKVRDDEIAQLKYDLGVSNTAYNEMAARLAEVIAKHDSAFNDTVVLEEALTEDHAKLAFLTDKFGQSAVIVLETAWENDSPEVEEYREAAIAFVAQVKAGDQEEVQEQEPEMGPPEEPPHPWELPSSGDDPGEVLDRQLYQEQPPENEVIIPGKGEQFP